MFQETQKLAQEIMENRTPVDQRCLIPRITWKRSADLVRTGK